ncbi:MAG: LptF/LptG family permease [Cyclobacteriaceae bacterium]|nr:LptF/LptG family permease [Cyclobacteriaceae bacterium]
MKILDRYIIRKVLSTFFFVVLIIVAIVVVIDITEKMDKFARNHLDFLTVLGYYRDFIPWIAGLITPITVFIATVFVTSRLAAHTEIIAILSGGTSFRRLLFPYFLSSLVIAIISFLLNGWVIPNSNRSRLEFELRYFENKIYFEKRNVHMQIEPNVYFFIQNYNNQSNTGYSFTLERFQDNRLTEKLEADQIVWDTTKAKWTLRRWKHRMMDDIFLANRDLANQIVQTGESKDTTLAITPADFESDARQYDGLTIPELRSHIAKMRFRGSAGVEAYEFEKYFRFSQPFTTFILVFMGVIVSSRKSRGGTGFQIALGFLLSFAFIIVFMMSRSFAETGSMTPFLAAWITNIIFAVISLGMYKYVPR